MRLLTLLTALAGALAVLLVTAVPTHACSCVEAKPAEYLKQADTVFVGRASAPVLEGNERAQTFHVYAALKGELGRTFTHRRPAGKRTSCDVWYRAGEVALVFVTGGKIQRCAGNHALSVMLPDLATCLSYGADKTETLWPEELRKAFEVTLEPYLHKRKKVWVLYPSLDGKEVKVKGTTFAFTKTARKGMLRIEAGFTRGLLHFVDAFFEPEGVRLRVLLGHAKAGPELIEKSVVEQARGAR